MCCSGPKWKREVVPDHKFDFVDVREFRDSGCFTRFRYLLVYVFVFKSFLVYVSDLYTAIAMLASNHWSGQILAQASVSDSKTVQVPFNIGKWIFTGCIIFSFLLLVYESRKARNIIKSRDISYAYTNVMANNYYTMKSYDHFSFFCQINNSRKKKDEFAFMVFFTFKGWKRLLLADAPRQAINGLTLYAFGKAFNFTTDISKYVDGSWVRGVVLVTMIFTVVVWIGSFILLCIAALMYVPLLCYIRGNLKEYVCHKVDKRIAELVKRKMKKRLLKEAILARKEEAGDYSHLQDKKGRMARKPMAQPTLPKIDLDDADYRSDVGSRRDYKEPVPMYDQGYNAYPPEKPHYLDEKASHQYYPEQRSEVGYNRSENGYAASTYSVETPYSHAPQYSSAPSYRSNGSRHEQDYFNEQQAPPVPSMPHQHEYYHQQQRSIDAQSIRSEGQQHAFYSAPSRQQLYTQTQQHQIERPESEYIDFSAYDDPKR